MTPAGTKPMTARQPRPETVAVQSKVSRDPKTACAMSMPDKSVDASPFQELKGWLLPNDSGHCMRAGAELRPTRPSRAANTPKHGRAFFHVYL